MGSRKRLLSTQTQATMPSPPARSPVSQAMGPEELNVNVVKMSSLTRALTLLVKWKLQVTCASKREAHVKSQ